MTTIPRAVRSRRLQEHDEGAVGDGRRQLARLGTHPRGVAGPGDRADARRHGGRGGRKPGPRRRRRRRRPRPCPPLGGRVPTEPCSPPTSPRRSCATPGGRRPMPAFQNVVTRVMDGEADRGRAADVRRGHLPGRAHLPAGPADVALTGMRRALRPGGRAAAIVYSTPGPQRVLLDPGLHHPSPRGAAAAGPGQPGPFSLGGEGVLAAALREAGFRDVEARVVTAPLRLPSAAECVRFERESFGALHQMLAGLDEAARQDAWGPISAEVDRIRGALTASSASASSRRCRYAGSEECHGEDHQLRVRLRGAGLRPTRT